MSRKKNEFDESLILLELKKLRQRKLMEEDDEVGRQKIKKNKKREQRNIWEKMEDKK